MTETPLDRAFAKMAENPDDGQLRLSFYERFADGELFILLASKSDGGDIEPRIFETETGRFVVAFDREDRLAAFADGAAEYAALSGRTLAGLLSGQSIGIGLNIGTEQSETLLTPASIEWLHTTLRDSPARAEVKPESVFPPADLPETLLKALDTKLALTTGLATSACLVGAAWADGHRGHLLAFLDAKPGTENALAQAVHEALVFSGVEIGPLDVTFLEGTDPVAKRLEKVGLRFDLPEIPGARPPKAPGTDPDNPPRLV